MIDRSLSTLSHDTRCERVVNSGLGS